MKLLKNSINFKLNESLEDPTKDRAQAFTFEVLILKILIKELLKFKSRKHLIQVKIKLRQTCHNF